MKLATTKAAESAMNLFRARNWKEDTGKTGAASMQGK
jgi:hypothetical protein